MVNFTNLSLLHDLSSRPRATAAVRSSGRAEERPMIDRTDEAAFRSGRRGPRIEWQREKMLPRLIGVGPEEIADRSGGGRSRILRRLMSALRSERMRGRAGHWSYSLDRHVGLVQAVEAERGALRRTLVGLPDADRGPGGRPVPPRAIG
jgi:hypothetical protein